MTAKQFNDYNVNELSIEEYDDELGKWVPIKGKCEIDGNNEFGIHRTPYIAYENNLLSVGVSRKTITMPEDGFVTASMFWNGLLEFAGTIDIKIFDEDGNQINRAFRSIENIALRPVIIHNDVFLSREVKKGWEVRFELTGITGGEWQYFLKLDPTYILVDENGNRI